MSVTTGVFGEDPADWDLRVDLSFGSPTDWQLEVWQHCIDTLPPQMLMHGTDTFWPIDPEMYREQYLQPQFGLFETATTDERVGTVRDWSVLRVLCSEQDFIVWLAPSIVWCTTATRLLNRPLKIVWISFWA